MKSVTVQRSLIVLLLAASMCCGMGEHGQQLTLSAPKFVPLEAGEESFAFAVTDEKTTTELLGVSFLGTTAITGVCREDNDSVTSIHLAYTKRLRVKEQDYQSARYPGKELCLVEKTNLDGTVTDGLLVPAKLVVCGVDRKTRDEESWFLGKIDLLERLDVPKGEHHDVVVAKHIDHMVASSKVKHDKHEKHEKRRVRPHDPKATKLLEHKEPFVEKRVVVLEKESGAMEKKTITQSLNDLVVAVIGVLKAFFEAVRGLFY